MSISYEDVNDTAGRIITITNKSSVLKVHEFGAHVLELQLCGHDILYLSPKAPLDGTKAIRGGIPLCFPQFGPTGVPGLSPLPQHGIARNKRWTLINTTDNSLKFQLRYDDSTLAVYPFRFTTTITYTVSGHEFIATWHVDNDDEKPMPFTCALHTYFKVNSITTTTVHGLNGCKYISNLDKKVAIENNDVIRINDEVDRVYYSVPNAVTIDSGTDSVTVNASGMPDCVLWNPASVKTSKMTDMPADGYLNFVCVENGCIEHAVIVEPHSSYTMQSTISI